MGKRDKLVKDLGFLSAYDDHVLRPKLEEEDGFDPSTVIPLGNGLRVMLKDATQLQLQQWLELLTRNIETQNSAFTRKQKWLVRHIKMMDERKASQVKDLYTTADGVPPDLDSKAAETQEMVHRNQLLQKEEKARYDILRRQRRV